MNLVSEPIYAQIYRQEDTCAKALNLGEELQRFYVARDTFWRVCSYLNAGKLIECYADLKVKANSFPDTRLHEAVSAGDLLRVPDIVRGGTLRRGVSVDAPGKNGARPLSIAAEKGDINAINLLLELGADIDAPDATGTSPLSYAVMTRQKDAVLLLLSKGADINFPDLFGMSPLFLAVANGDQDMFRLLLSRGAHLILTDVTVKTVLHMAVISSNIPNMKDRIGMVEAILDAADEYGWPAESRIINASEPIDGDTPLHKAASRGQADVMRVFLQRGARLKARNKHGELAIHLAASANEVETFFIMLIENPELLNVKDKKGQTPVDAARANKSQNILLALNLREEYEAFFAAKDTLLKVPSPDNANRLIDLFNNLWDKSDTMLNTRLHLAAHQNKPSEITHLVSHGTPVDVLGQTGATPLAVAAASGHIEAIDTLLDLGADINAPDAIGNPPLTYAVVSGKAHVVKHLLDKGADINRANFAHETPVISATRNGYQDIFRLLASHGADLMNTNVQGWNLLHIAIFYPEVKNRAGMVETILDTVESQEEIIYWPEHVAGALPLHWAAYQGRVDVMRILLQRGANSVEKGGLSV